MVIENRQGRENTTEWFRNEVKIMSKGLEKIVKDSDWEMKIKRLREGWEHIEDFGRNH